MTDPTLCFYDNEAFQSLLVSPLPFVVPYPAISNTYKTMPAKYTP